jgi:hypothetical protein
MCQQKEWGHCCIAGGHWGACTGESAKDALHDVLTSNGYVQSFSSTASLGTGKSYPPETECQNPNPRRNTTVFRPARDNMISRP